jgi:hypothetical protein
MGLSVSSCRKEEHPSKEAATGGLTRDELADAIESYVAQEAASHGGYFTVFDETVGKELKLKLDKVHRQRLSRVGEDLYFSCADFKTDGGKIYDLDVFMQGSEKADLTFTEFMIPARRKLSIRRNILQSIHLNIRNNLRLLLDSSEVCEHARRVEITYEFTISDIKEGWQDMRAWVPLPLSNYQQKLEEFEIAGEQAYEIVKEDEYGNQFLLLDLGKGALSGGGEVAVTIKFRVIRYAANPLEEPGSSSGRPVSDGNLGRYLIADSMVPIDGIIAEEAHAAAGGFQNPLEQARRLYDHIAGSLSYDKSGTGWGRGDAIYACTIRKGNCTDFHSLFIGEARALGIPSRFIMGLPIPEDKKKGNISGYHCWGEFYLTEKGWLPVDAAEANKFPAKKELLFGRLDEHRVAFTVGRDIKLPGSSVESINYSIYPHVEVDGQPYESVETRFSFKDYRDKHK